MVDPLVNILVRCGLLKEDLDYQVRYEPILSLLTRLPAPSRRDAVPVVVDTLGQLLLAEPRKL